MKRFDEKKNILGHYKQMIDSFDKLQIISIYLKYIIDNVDSDKDLLELELDIPILNNLFSIDGDKIYRFQLEIDKLFNKLEINKKTKIDDARFIEISKRLLEYAKSNDKTT